jgi:large subunit ribosomal protein L23
MAEIKDVLKRPIITEKLTEAGETLNKYGFLVDRKANKLQIRTAIEEMYGVTVESVNTMRYRGKNRMRYTKAGIIRGKESDTKKAVVTLAEGDSIDFYSNI